MAENTTPLDNLKNELKLIGKINDLLKAGQFNGAWAQDLAIGQMYMQSLHQNLKAEIEKRE